MVISVGGGILTNFKNIYYIFLVDKKQAVHIPLVNIFAIKIIQIKIV